MKIKIYLSNGDQMEMNVTEEYLNKIFTGNSEQLCKLNFNNKTVVINLSHIVYIEEVA